MEESKVAEKHPISANNSESNLSIFGIDLFNISMINPDRFILALEIYERYLSSIFNFFENRNELDLKAITGALNMIEETKQFNDELFNTLRSIETNTDELSKYYKENLTRMNNLKNIYESENHQIDIISLKINEENNSIERKIESIKRDMKYYLNRCTKEDLKSAWQKLHKSKDKYHIIVIESLVSLLSSNTDLTPEYVGEKVNKYSKLIDEMLNIDQSFLLIESLQSIYNKLLRIDNEINPQKSVNKGDIESYKHLINYSSWSMRCCEYFILNWEKKEMGRNLNNGQINRTVNLECIDQINEYMKEYNNYLEILDKDEYLINEKKEFSLLIPIHNEIEKRINDELQDLKSLFVKNEAKFYDSSEGIKESQKIQLKMLYEYSLQIQNESSYKKISKTNKGDKRSAVLTMENKIISEIEKTKLANCATCNIF